MRWRFGERPLFRLERESWAGVGCWDSAGWDSGSRERFRPFCTAGSVLGVLREDGWEAGSGAEVGLLWKSRVGSLESASEIEKSG